MTVTRKWRNLTLHPNITKSFQLKMKRHYRASELCRVFEREGSGDRNSLLTTGILSSLSHPCKKSKIFRHTENIKHFITNNSDFLKTCANKQHIYDFHSRLSTLKIYTRELTGAPKDRDNLRTIALDAASTGFCK